MAIAQTATIEGPGDAAPAAKARRRHFPLFDSLRAAGAIAVLVFHVGLTSRVIQDTAVGHVVARLDIGVALFFVLAGFLLYRPYAAARLDGGRWPGLRSYLRRRALRILPGYWVALTALAILPGLTGVFTGDWWRYYGLLQIYSPETQYLGLTPAWSLCVEVSFYLLLPLYAVAVRRAIAGRPRERQVRMELWLLAALFVATIVLRRILVFGFGPFEAQPFMTSTVVGTWDWFAVGMALAVLSVRYDDVPSPPRAITFVRQHPLALWTAALAMFLVLSIPRGNPYDVHHFGYGIIGALVVLPAVFGDDLGGLPRRVLRHRTSAWLGAISYGIFLWHEPLTDWLWEKGIGDLGMAGGFVALLVVTLGLSILLGALSFYLVERPFLRMKTGGQRAGASDILARSSLRPRAWRNRLLLRSTAD